MDNNQNRTNGLTESTARAQRCLYCGAEFPLYPPILHGCPECVTDDFKAPLEIVYDYPKTTDWLPDAPLPGMTRYAPVLPPLSEKVSMGEGGTALVPYYGDIPGLECEVYIKDESRNPTWSHKDRLNLCVTSTALAMDAPGIVAASSGNHGAACAAYAARAGLPAIILCTPRPPAVASFLQAYGQTIVAVPNPDDRWTVMEHIIDKMKYHPASNFTTPPTNHPFGSEGYKTIAYEVFLQLDRRAPEAVFIPVGYAELLFGVYKGFKELYQFGLIDMMPHIIGCEPSAGAPLRKAVHSGERVAHVDVGDSDAYAIAVPVNSYRGVVAVQDSEGDSVSVTEAEMKQAQVALGKAGMWSETSSAIALGGVYHAPEIGIGKRGPIVCISTSSGFKDIHVGDNDVPLIDGTWEGLQELLKN